MRKAQSRKAAALGRRLLAPAYRRRAAGGAATRTCVTCRLEPLAPFACDPEDPLPICRCLVDDDVRRAAADIMSGEELITALADSMVSACSTA